MQATISIIIPLTKLSTYLIEETLPAIEKQTHKEYEVIVLPNRKSAQDVELLEKYSWLRIVATDRATRPAQKRDIGVRHATGEIIAFIDDDAYPEEAWLENALRLFKKKGVVAVCGPGLLPPGAATWERIFDAVVTTWIGSGGYSYRFQKERARFVDDYPSMNFFVLKDKFQKVGGFNSDYWPGEDSKLCEDIVYKLGGRILYHPSVAVYHHRRPSLTNYLTQHGNYGFHRGAFFAHGDKNSRRLEYLAPTAFVMYLVFLILARYTLQVTRYTALFLLPLVLYLVALMYLYARTFEKTKDATIATGAVVVLFLTHVVYGLQFIRGFITGLVKKDNIYG